MRRVAVLACVAVVVGIAHAPISGATVAKPTVHFVGDSITVGATPMLRSYFGMSYRAPKATAYAVTVNAVSGSDTLSDAHFVYADARVAPTVEVINLGTNDTNHIGVAYRGEPAQTLADVFHRFNVFGSHALFPHTCVVFVNINTHTLSWNPVNAARINAHLRAFRHVVDWNGAWNPRYFVGTDNVHPNTLGQHVLVHLIGLETAKCS